MISRFFMITDFKNRVQAILNLIDIENIVRFFIEWLEMACTCFFSSQ